MNEEKRVKELLQIYSDDGVASEELRACCAADTWPWTISNCDEGVDSA